MSGSLCLEVCVCGLVCGSGDARDSPKRGRGDRLGQCNTLSLSVSSPPKSRPKLKVLQLESVQVCVCV